MCASPLALTSFYSSNPLQTTPCRECSERGLASESRRLDSVFTLVFPSRGSDYPVVGKAHIAHNIFMCSFFQSHKVRMQLHEKSVSRTWSLFSLPSAGLSLAYFACLFYNLFPGWFINILGSGVRQPWTCLSEPWFPDLCSEG